MGMTSKIHLRPRGQTISEQVKEIQKNLSFPLNSIWRIEEIKAIHLFLKNKIFELFVFLKLKVNSEHSLVIFYYCIIFKYYN
jgi:hypothetical protein